MVFSGVLASSLQCIVECSTVKRPFHPHAYIFIYLLWELQGLCLRTEKSGQTPCLEQTIFVFALEWWLFKITRGGGACGSQHFRGALVQCVSRSHGLISRSASAPHPPTPPAHCVQTLETVHLLYFWWSLSKVQTVIYCCSITSAHSYNDYSLSSLSLPAWFPVVSFSLSYTHTHMDEHSTQLSIMFATRVSGAGTVSTPRVL